MRKIWILLLAVAMLLTLSACAEEPSNAELMITRAAEETIQMQDGPAETESREEKVTLVSDYVFVFDGVELVPGTEFRKNELPKEKSVYKVPSCAIDGTDNVYNYETFELTAFQEGGSGEVIYSILLLDPNIATTEGLALGDHADRVLELYGNGYTQEGSAWVYQGPENALYVIFQGEYVASIEYRMVTNQSA